MSIGTVQQNYSEDERAAVTEFEERFARVARGKHLDDWLKMIPGLQAMAKAAMAFANVTERKSKPYNKAFAALVHEHARKVSNRVSLETIEKMKQPFSYLLWLADKPDRLAILNAELDKMPLHRRVNITSPGMAYKLVKAVEDQARAETVATATPKQEAAAEQLADDGTPTPTEAQMLNVLTRSLRKRGVNQTALALLRADFDLFKDLAGALNREIRAAYLDAKDAKRRKGANAR